MKTVFKWNTVEIRRDIDSVPFIGSQVAIAGLLFAPLPIVSEVIFDYISEPNQIIIILK